MTSQAWLKLSKAELSTSGWIRVYLEFWNRTDSPLLFSWSEEVNFHLEDNLGREYAVHSHYRGVVRESIEPQERTRLNMPFYESTVTYNDERFFEPAVTDLYLTITDLSRITYAKWHIVVPK